MSYRVRGLICGLLICTASFGVLARIVKAQSSSASWIRGQVVSQTPLAFGDLFVEIHPMTGGGDAVRTAVSSDGSFEVGTSNWQASDWIEIVVLNRRGATLHRETATMAAEPLRIRLAKQKVAEAARGVISLEELQRPPSKRFRKEMHRSERALSRNDLPESVGHLARAVELEPARVEAHTRLGVVLLQMKSYGEALSAFEKATELSPDLEAAQAGRAMSLHGLGRLAEAAEQARFALQAHPDSARCHYVLGLILAQTGQRDDAVLAHLKRAYAEYPHALLVAAHVYAARGERQQEAEALWQCVKEVEPGSDHHAACSAQLERFGDPKPPKIESDTDRESRR